MPFGRKCVGARLTVRAMWLTDTLQRLRHSRGFGIHSPLAFTIATDIIRCRYAYYAYPEIDDSLRGADDLRRLRRRCRMIFRLIARYSPAEAFVSASWHPSMRRACQLADSRLKWIETSEISAVSAPVIAVIHGDDMSAHLKFIKALTGPEEAFIFIAGGDEEILTRLDSMVKSGVIFRNRGTRLYILRKGIVPVNHIIPL